MKEKDESPRVTALRAEAAYLQDTLKDILKNEPGGKLSKRKRPKIKLTEKDKDIIDEEMKEDEYVYSGTSEEEDDSI